MTREQIEQMAKEGLCPNELLFADGHDNAIVGVNLDSQFDRPVCVIYSRSQIIENLMEDGCSYEEAEEHFGFNIAGSYVGHHTPLYVDTEPPV